MVAALKVDYSTPRGGAGTSISSGLIEDLDHNAEVRGAKWYGDSWSIGIAGKMLRDPHVRKSVEAITDPLLGAKWVFKPASKDPLDVEIAAFCEHVFFERNNWSEALLLICNYIRDGFSILELTLDNRPIAKTSFPKHPGNGNAWIYTGFHDRPAKTIAAWYQSSIDPRKLAGIQQWIPGSDGEVSGHYDVPADRLLRFTWGQEGANYAGFPPLRSAYGAWKTKIMLMIADAIRHEREGNGIPTISLPESASPADEERANAILEDIRMHERARLTLPYGFEFKFTTTTGQSTGLGEAIERCNRDIAFNMDVAWMLLSVGTDTGSHALAQTQRGKYVLSLEKHKQFIENAFNLGTDGWSPVERLVRANYGAEVALPRLLARNMPTRDWESVLPVVHNLATSKIITPDDLLEDSIRENLDLPVRDPATAREVSLGASPLGRDTKLPNGSQEPPADNTEQRRKAA